MGHLWSLEQQSASAADCLLGKKSEYSHLNDGTAAVRVSHYTVHYDPKESRARNFQQRRHCDGARLALHTVHCGLKESRVRNFQQRRHCKGARLALHIVH